jgi:hypothetical protein
VTGALGARYRRRHRSAVEDWSRGRRRYAAEPGKFPHSCKDTWDRELSGHPDGAYPNERLQLPVATHITNPRDPEAAELGCSRHGESSEGQAQELISTGLNESAWSIPNLDSTTNNQELYLLPKPLVLPTWTTPRRGEETLVLDLSQPCASPLDPSVITRPSSARLPPEAQTFADRGSILPSPPASDIRPSLPVLLGRIRLWGEEEKERTEPVRGICCIMGFDGRVKSLK